MLQSGQKIIPIFYKVDPGDIRWKNVYDDAFSKHEAKGRYSLRRLEDWKSALNDVLLLTGPVVNNEGDEGVLEIIKNQVLMHYKKISFEVAQHLVGLDETLQDFERSVLRSENANIVGITGRSRCGKTTLAKAFYNKKMCSFYRHSFVCNVQDESTINLLEKILQDIGGSKDISFGSVDEGKGILADYLRSAPVLIVLDNVGQPDQLDSLLPVKDNLRQDSKIVVTSRDPNILISWGMFTNSIYQMKELSLDNAKELFCWRAFLQPAPINGFEYLVQRFLDVCRGLPLSLKVLGSLVHGKESRDYWDAQLDGVSRLLPGDIKNLLKVSFDELDAVEKEVFLDICCFFTGMQTHSVITVWDGSGWNGACALETLVNKSLVEVDEGNHLRMHDELRDLGREITMTSPPYRLWSPEQITHIEKQGKEIVPIRGIKAGTDELHKKLLELARGSGGRSTRHLKILDIENSFFTEELAAVIAAPVWVRWFKSPFTDLPSRILSKKLRVLEFVGAPELQHLWAETANPPQQLRNLKIESCSKLRKLPINFRLCRNLQDIRFKDCSDFTFPPEILAHLPRLSHLDVFKCPGFTELVIQSPGFSSSSPSILKSTTLKECHVSRISISTECCPSLEQLVLDGNEHLAEIDSLPISLKNLRIKECGKLWKIEGLENCRSLETLMAHTWRTAPLVQNLKHMESLRSASLAAACYISKFEPCIQTLNRKKWPSLCTIFGSAAPGVEAVMNSFTFPGLTLVHSLDRRKDTDNWKYVFQRERLSTEAAMICLVINSASDAMTLHMTCVADNNFNLTRVKEGRWVFIGVFTQSSLMGNEVLFFLSTAGVPLEFDSVEMGMLAMGEENVVVDAFYKLLQPLGKVSETKAEMPKITSNL